MRAQPSLFPTVIALVLLPVVAAVGCVLPDTRNEGRACTVTGDCGEEKLECVTVATDEGDRSVCLPVIDHPPFACATLDDCTSQLFPVEADCIQDRCQCPVNSLPCPRDREALDPFTCACVFTTGDEGELCFEDVGVQCRFGLSCVESRCRRGQAPGDPCSSDYPCAGANLICNGASACTGDTGASCTLDEDCATFVCDNNRCN